MYIILHFKRTLVGLQKYCFDTFFQYHFHVFQLIVAGMGISPCKWYMALFHYFKEMCLVNSHILYEQDGHKGTVKDFRREIVTGLVQPYMASQPTQSPNANAMGRLAVAAFGHFPAQFEDKKHRPNCKVCSLVKVRAQTRFYCPVCNVALCVSTCFRIYHTAENIRAAREQVNP